jgi:leucyl aminopeptidase
MNIHTTNTGKEEIIIIPVSEDYDKKQYSKKILAHFEKKNFSGKKLTTTLVQEEPQKLFIGAGKNSDADIIRKIAGAGMKIARQERAQRVAIDLRGYDEHAGAAVEGAHLGLYLYEAYKKRDTETAQDPSDLTLITKDQKQAAEAAKKASIISKNIILVRDLVNKPASDKNPEQLAKLIATLAKKEGIGITILGTKELEKLGMGAMLGVARGSSKEAKLVILEINGKNKEKPLVLAGKGVTFDAGGLQIKPGSYMQDMKMDMAGAATVLGTLITLKQLGYNKKVIGMMGFVENLVGENAYKPGDILTAYNGKTIEIGHTDAEGRLVLADVISYAEKNYSPACIIDLATLTGAAIYALGYRVAPIMGNNKELLEAMEKSSAETAELVWRLPLYNHYKKLMEGSISDLINVQQVPNNAGPGTISAGAFLSEFVTEKTPWIHIDIAGTAYCYEEGNYVHKGGTGWGVRLLSNLIMKQEQTKKKQS